MSIAVNGVKLSSPFGGADSRLRFYLSSQSRSSERRRGILLFQTINISPLTG